MLNTTDEHTNSSFEVRYPASLVGMSAAFAALNTFFSITATLGNILILLALNKVTSIRPPTKLLFRCLAVTDLCVGLVTQPLFTVMLLASLNFNEYFYVDLIEGISSIVLCGVSLLTSTAISVDRLLALSLGLRYRYVVTLRRVRALIISFWFLIGASVGCASISGINLFVYAVVILISLLISAISYANVHFRLRHQLFHVQGHVHQRQQLPPNGVVPSALNVARYKKTVSFIAWVQLGLFACYSPLCIVLISFHFEEFWDLNIIYFFLCLLYLNSSLNPILYCWKIREVKQAVKDIIRQLNCCCELN
ncbi:adenosine receptor A3-like [Pocillopora verrucosa]|uniref:adenosine receptor A3-like n=1 Tax=Pocillopora verrucosa TaxID=203993 RepID=UPI003341F3DD